MNIFKTLFGGRTGRHNEEKKAPDFDTLKADGVNALLKLQYAEAVEYLVRALQLNAADIDCRDSLAQAYEGAGNYAAAYEQLQKVVEERPGDAAIFLRMAGLACRMHSYTAMSDACEKALLIDNRNWKTYSLYAEACRGLGDDVNAEAMETMAKRLQGK